MTPVPAVSGATLASDEESRGGTAMATATVRPEMSQTPSMQPDQLASEARRITEAVMHAMGFDATVTATADVDRADVSLSVAAHDDLLTGPKGEVRQALQHLLNLMLNRGQTGRYHLQLEINGFWAKREQELDQLARQLAEEALASGNEVVTEYLNSQERRIVHVTLKEDVRVKTYALGTGLIKRVAVAPADFAGGPRDDEE
jgi:spoIIIJ-associated protein